MSIQKFLSVNERPGQVVYGLPVVYALGLKVFFCLVQFCLCWKTREDVEVYHVNEPASIFLRGVDKASQSPTSFYFVLDMGGIEQVESLSIGDIIAAFGFEAGIAGRPAEHFEKLAGYTAVNEFD